MNKKVKWKICGLLLIWIPNYLCGDGAADDDDKKDGNDDGNIQGSSYSGQMVAWVQKCTRMATQFFGIHITIALHCDEKMWRRWNFDNDAAWFNFIIWERQS